MLEFVVHFISINGKNNFKIFRNPNDVLTYIEKYQVEKIDVNGEDFGDTYTPEEFEEGYSK